MGPAMSDNLTLRSKSPRKAGKLSSILVSVPGFGGRELTAGR